MVINKNAGEMGGGGRGGGFPFHVGIFGIRLRAIPLPNAEPEVNTRNIC